MTIAPVPVLVLVVLVASLLCLEGQSMGTQAGGEGQRETVCVYSTGSVCYRGQCPLLTDFKQDTTQFLTIN